MTRGWMRGFDLIGVVQEKITSSARISTKEFRTNPSSAQVGLRAIWGNGWPIPSIPIVLSPSPLASPRLGCLLSILLRTIAFKAASPVLYYVYTPTFPKIIPTFLALPFCDRNVNHAKLTITPAFATRWLSSSRLTLYARCNFSRCGETSPLLSVCVTKDWYWGSGRDYLILKLKSWEISLLVSPRSDWYFFGDLPPENVTHLYIHELQLITGVELSKERHIER